MTLKKSAIPRPTLAKETVDVPELGGEVVVKALLMRERLHLATVEGQPRFGQIAGLLAATVVDEDGLAVFDVDEWEIFGAKNQDAAWKLFQVAQRLSGMGEEEQKKDLPPS